MADWFDPDDACDVFGPAVPVPDRVVPLPRQCADSDTGRTDDVRQRCFERAVVECLTINGRWEPLCERHATYDADRTRPLGTVDAARQDTP